jgi:glycosyltransferase involved in cell wall biosynthesis/SAM-dependent methyltransferase
MRVAILTTQCPFVVGGAELHAQSLQRILCEFGHEAEIVAMPFKWYPATTILDHMVAARLLDVSEFTGVKIDLAIALKFPAYLMRHPNKVFWILHQHRQSYDLWDNGHSDLLGDPDGQVVREAIRKSDNIELGAAQRIFANSNNVAKRLLKYNQIKAEPLYHPPPLADRLRSESFDNFFYYPSRIAQPKRQEFVLRSLAHARRDFRVVFSGAPDNPQYGAEMKQLARSLGVESRVEWRGFVSEDEIIDFYARARGVLFTPIDEDLGYIALEAMLAGKPLLTLADAGEPASLITDGVEGFVTPSDPKLFAKAMDRLAGDVALAQEMGAAGLQKYRDLNISWANVVEKLVNANGPKSELPPPAPSQCAPTEMEPAEIANDDPAPAPSPILPFAKSPERSPVLTGPTIEHLFQCYNFGVHFEYAEDYLRSHWMRYLATVDAIKRSAVEPLRILEIGASPPYVFTALLKEMYPAAKVTVIQEGPAGRQWKETIKHRSDETQNVDLDVIGLNVETSPIPLPEGYFDLVMGMEILEHLAIDPSFMFREVARVTREGGVFLVTTPNLVSLQGVWRALNGGSPYSFGLFVPWNGAYGRHNREYTPHEVEQLGRYASFETALLETIDVYRQERPPDALLRFMAENLCPLDHRGQNIFFIGRKNSATESIAYPANQFPTDPAVFSGELELISTPGARDAFTIRAWNRSPLIWRHEGHGRVRLSIDRVDQNGLVARDMMKIALPADIPPDGHADVPVLAIQGSGRHSYWYEIGLYLDGAGPFKGAGRTKTLAVFAESLEVAKSGNGVLDAP